MRDVRSALRDPGGPDAARKLNDRIYNRVVQFLVWFVVNWFSLSIYVVHTPGHRRWPWLLHQLYLLEDRTFFSLLVLRDLFLHICFACSSVSYQLLSFRYGVIHSVKFVQCVLD